MRDNMKKCMPLHYNTPLIKHYNLSNQLNKNIWLKMDCFQPVQSFKIRGIGKLCVNAKEKGYSHLVSASGGNAGYATAYSGYCLNMSVTVFMPNNAAISTQNRLKELGANVILSGDSLDDAQKSALEYAEKYAAFFVPPFNHPIIWEGHSTIIDELTEQMEEQPDTIVMSVGGGGLMCGIIQGIDRHNWENVKIITSETIGTSSLKQSVEAHKLIKLNSTQGIATSLGAKQVAEQAFEYTKNHDITCLSVSDEESLQACVRFANEQKVLVEPACGATLAVLYNHQHALENLKNIVFIVCGGINTHWLMVSCADV